MRALGAGPIADGLPYFTLADATPVLSGLWAVKGVLPLRGIAVIYGPSGGGKTFVATDLLMAVARGVPWRGRKTTQTAVLYLAPDGGSVFVNRLCAYRLHHGIDEAPFFAVGGPVDILGKINAGDVAKLEVLIADIEKTRGVIIGVIVVDTVSRAMPGGDENQPADMSRFVDNLGGNGDRLVVGVHHTPKSDATVIRGHSSLHGAADCELNVKDGAIRVAKSREGPDNETFGFRLEVVELGFDEDGDTVTSCVAVPTDVPKKRPAKVTGAARLALDQLRNTIIEAGEPLPRVDKMPRARGVKVDLWRQRCKLAQVGEVDKPNTFLTAFRRSASKLQELGIIGVWDGWVWLVDGVDS
jgi:AAA domain-containing protein